MTSSQAGLHVLNSEQNTKQPGARVHEKPESGSGAARRLLANVGRVGRNDEVTPERREAAQNADGPDDPAWRWLRLCDTVAPAPSLGHCWGPRKNVDFRNAVSVQ